jgi:hypothetical protein
MITGLHALSSASGGLDAVKKVQQSEPLHRWIVGGDFNYHLPRALGVPGPATFAPAWHAPHVNLAFTQWNRKGLRPLPSGPMHFANPTTFYTPGEGTLKTNDILDYVMYNLMTVTPLPIVPPNQCCPPWDGGQNAPKLHPPRLEALRTTPGERWWFALPPASKLWYRILLHFDHCPVLYDVQFPP